MTITGRSGGSGPYSFRATHSGTKSVLVANMPEDDYKIRIIFRSHGETEIPITKIDETYAILLWASLSEMANDLKWDKKTFLEKIEDTRKALEE